MQVQIGKFFLDVIVEIHKLLKERKQEKENYIAVGTFIELYGSVIRLEGISKEVYLIIDDISKSELLGNRLKDFFDEMGYFGNVLKKANLATIEIFHPQLGYALNHLIIGDELLHDAIERTILPHKKNIKSKQLKRVIDIYVKNYGNLYMYQWDVEMIAYRNLPDRWDGTEEWNKSKVIEQFKNLTNHLEKFKTILADVIKNTWDFKELATLSKN